MGVLGVDKFMFQKDDLGDSWDTGDQKKKLSRQQKPETLVKILIKTSVFLSSSKHETKNCWKLGLVMLLYEEASSIKCESHTVSAHSNQSEFK